MREEKYFVIDDAEFENTPWQQMRAQYDAATEQYRIASRRQPMKGEDPRSIEQVAAKDFYYQCIAIKNQHPDVDNYPCPLTFNGKSYDSSGTKRLVKDRMVNDTHISLKNSLSISDQYDQKTIYDQIRDFR